MNVDITKQEAWKIIDAIKAYTKDYSVSGAVEKTFHNITNKLKKVTND
jgi:sulfur relay (sulfurtransferase) DsrC/TusE family protein